MLSKILIMFVVARLSSTNLTDINNFLKENIESVAFKVMKEIEKNFANRCASKCVCANHHCDVNFKKICDSRWSTDSCSTCGRQVNLDNSIIVVGNMFYEVDTDDPYVMK
jgi:hypothetical protein